MTYARTTIPVLAVLTALASCGGDAAETSIDVSLGLPEMTSRAAGWSEARAELGKKLFFDTRLSSNGEMSCSTCHLHEHGWTDGKQFSQKVDGSMNTRNSPSLYNTGYQSLYYWDGRAPSMEDNVAAAWKGHMVGSDEQMTAVVAAVAAVAPYGEEFQAAFGTAPTQQGIVDALCAFVRSLQAGGTRYDAYLDGDTSALTPQEVAGMSFVNANCISCHLIPLFTDNLFHNVGIGMDQETPDPGRQKVDPTAALGSFKTPTLRGVTKTAPYFHDGSVATLEEAVRIMATGGIDNEHRDPILNETLAKNPLTEQQIGQIVAFLKALEPRETFTKPILP